jgi:hypothetical protein
VVVATYKNGSAYKRVGAICVLHRLPEEMGLVDPQYQQHSTVGPGLSSEEPYGPSLPSL